MRTTNKIKLDQFKSWYTKRLDLVLRPQDFIDVFKVSSIDTIKGLMEKLVALHKPGRIDYIRRFDLAEILVAPATVAAPRALTNKAAAVEKVTNGDNAKRVCAACDVAIADVVAKFCMNNVRRFKGLTYCRPCQTKY